MSIGAARTASSSALAIVAAACALGWASPGAARDGAALPAQSVSDDALSAELQSLRNQIQVLSAKIERLEAQAADEADPASGPHAVEPAPAAPPGATAKPATTIAWDGAPRIEATVDPKAPDAGRWSFKPRGRLQIDTAAVHAPSGVGPGGSLGLATEFRRAFLGVEGTLPGHFGYRMEADFADNGVELTDVYLSYKPTPATMVVLGQHKPFWGLEELTSDLFTSFMERAAFNSAFGFQRRVGLSAQYAKDALLLQGGVFTDNAADLGNDANNSYSLDGRAVFAPKVGSGVLHIGASAHVREFNDQASTARYRARPFVHTTDVRLVDTLAFNAVGERSYGLELAYIAGRFHATAEGHHLAVRRLGTPDPTFQGGYAEVGYLLTDDLTPYKGGAYDRIRPKNGFERGGKGALQINARYDFLDLNDAGIVGGRQQIAGASLVWVPTDYVRFVLNYGRVWIDDAAIAAGTDRSYEADALGMRAQIDF